MKGINNPCPEGFRVPTYAEWEAERASWISNNSAGAFASPLKLPLAGDRNYSSGLLTSVGSFGYYWSATVGLTGAQNMYFYSGGDNVSSNYRSYGISVRCIKD